MDNQEIKKEPLEPKDTPNPDAKSDNTEPSVKDLLKEISNLKEMVTKNQEQMYDWLNKQKVDNPSNSKVDEPLSNQPNDKPNKKHIDF